MTEVKIMVGGPESSLPLDVYQSNAADVVWIGVDHGAIRLLKEGIQPDLAVGDFDSVTEDERMLLEEQINDVRSAPSEKDDTDTELALQLALEEYKPDKISIYGATAGRLDHLMSNFFFVFQPRFKPHASLISLYDRFNSVSFYLPGEYQVKRERNKPYAGFVCMTPVQKLTLRGFKYPLEEKDYAYPISLASNEFKENDASFSFTEGLVAFIQSKDGK